MQAMDSIWFEEEIDFPSEAVKNSIGLAFDIGGSVIKIVYRSKDDYCKGLPRDKTKGKDTGILHLLHCSRNNLEQALDYAIEKCDWLRESANEASSLFTTGVGSNFLYDKLNKKLETSIHIEVEFNCFARALHYMSNNLSHDQLFHHLSKEGNVRAESIIDFFADFGKKMENFSEGTLETSEKESEERKEEIQSIISNGQGTSKSGPLLPAILCICGSATAIIKVEKDGTWRALEVIAGGVTFLGLAKMLTGENDFNAVIQLALRGDRGKKSSVDVYAAELKHDKDSDGYAAFPDDLMVFPFGKLVTDDLDNIQKEDLAFSLLNIMCMTIAQAAHMHSVLAEVNNLYFCGNFVNHPHVRTLLTENMAIRNFTRPGGSPPVDFRFICAGGHLGALGAYLMGNQ